jgi:hypothetical protein
MATTFTKMATKFTKWPLNRPNDHVKYQHLPLQDPPKFTQIGIFGFKICRLATLLQGNWLRKMKMREEDEGSKPICKSTYFSST